MTLALTIAIGALLTRRQVGRNQTAALARRADEYALERRQRPSYVNEDRVAGRVRIIVRPRATFARLVPHVNRGSDGTTTVGGRRYLYSYRVLPHRGLLLLRPQSLREAEWRPFVRDLLVAGLAGAAVAAALSVVLARSITRPIRRVSEAARALAAGEHASVPEEGSRELAALARAFNEMADDLARARDAERAFLLSVSHELKTPLTAIRGYAEGLAEGAFAPEDAARVIGVEARRLERLVRDLLDLARMNRAEFSVRREAVDLADVAREAVARHDAAAREFGVALAAEGDEAWVEADADRVLQVASNLVENALRETPRGGSVTVRAQPGRLVVADTGAGLTPDEVPRAFERFYLYDKRGRDRPVGSGLGLAIVKQLAVAMRGNVSVESSPGAGATFTVRLPQLRVERRGVDDLEVGAVHAPQ